MFPRFTLATDASAKAFTGEGSDSGDELYIGHGSSVWNNVSGLTGRFNRKSSIYIKKDS
jgi:hypothetical protein